MSELAAALSRRRAMESGDIWADRVPFHNLELFKSEEEFVAVFLGSGRDAENLNKLNDNRIGRVLNVADDVPNYHEYVGEIIYCRLDVADFGAEAIKGRGIYLAFEKARTFVEDGLVSNLSQCSVSKDRPNILVHCANGSNRSVTIVIALLMIIDGCDLRNA